MKILFHSWEYPPNGSGVATYVSNMSRALVQLGHEAMVVTGCACGEEARSVCEGVQIRRCYGWDDVRSGSTAERVLELADEFGADVIEVADHLGQAAALARYPKRPPLLVRMHSCNVHRVLHASQAWYPWQRLMIQLACLRNWRQVRAERIGIAEADAVLASSQRLLDVSVAQGLRMPASRGAVPNPYVMPSLAFEPTADEATVPTIIFVGRLDMGKGIGYLPKILQRVAQRIPNVRLEIAGGDSFARGLGSLRSWLQRRFSQAGVLENVRFLGRIGPDDLDQAYRRAWVQIIPSRWDTFPGVALEGMARGKPIVASPHGGMPEMLEGTVCGTALPESYEFVKLVFAQMDDVSLRRQAGASLKEKVLNAYSPEVVVAEYVAKLKGWGIG
jgi:glycosyltransferase involved in cell wall biosynthesis